MAFHGISWVPAVIFLISYLLIAVESNIGSYLDRRSAAFCGAVAIVLARVLTLDAAYQAIRGRGGKPVAGKIPLEEEPQNSDVKQQPGDYNRRKVGQESQKGEVAATPISAFCGLPVTDRLEPMLAEVANATT